MQIKHKKPHTRSDKVTLTKGLEKCLTVPPEKF